MFNFFAKKPPKPASSVSINQASVIEEYDDIEPIAIYFKEQTGITFEKQKSILKSKLTSFCTIRKIRSFKQCLSQVKNNPILKQELINYLTTNESFFYREVDQIQTLVNQVIPLTRRVDILCAPCSTGEELYSIAIALLEAGVPKSRFDIVGIDINTVALSHAKDAIYNQRNISNLPLQVLNQYFINKGSKYHLKNNVKDCVLLKAENVFSSSFKTIGQFDFIFSRNMLIYFDKETKIKAKNILESLLKERNTPVFFGHADLF